MTLPPPLSGPVLLLRNPCYHPDHVVVARAVAFLCTAEDPRDVVHRAVQALAEGKLVVFPTETVYGLAASAWTTGIFRALRAQREIRAGCVWINDHIPIVSEMPHGGFGQSGFGKDMSMYSFEEYTNVKHVSMDITGEARKPWHRTIFTDR